MYNEFYSFYEEPFNITPDPRFIYWGPSHKEAMASLLYGLKNRRGFICLVAEVGMGKTTLINALLNELGEDAITSVVNTPKVVNTQEDSFVEILKLMLTDFGIPIEGLGRFEMFEALKKFIARQTENHKNVVLIIDESQCLDDSVFEDLRLLSNFETAKYKLLQILLVGQPELIEKLKQPHLRQLRQRLSVNCFINPFNKNETREYIEHRLREVGRSLQGVFKQEALEIIESYTNGIPRKINIVCHNALLIGYALGEKRIGRKIIKEVIDDLEFTNVQSERVSVGNEKKVEKKRKAKRSYSLSLIVEVVILGLALILLFIIIV